VEEGGTVIADVRPGIYDDHCKPQAPGALDDLFGIKHTGRGKGKRGPLNLNAKLGETPISLQLDETNMDAEVAVESAQALGSVEGTPVFLVNKVGRGQAILLNFEIAHPPKTKKKESAAISDTVKQFVAALYAAAGVQPALIVKRSDGGFLDLVEPRVWKNGEATVLGLWNELNIRFFAMDGKVPEAVAQEATITLPEERYVYDLRQGTALGKTKELRTRLLPGRANFFGLFRCEIQGLKLSVSPNAPKPGQSVEVNLALDTPTPVKAKTAVYILVFDPKGQPAAWANRVVLLEDGVGRTTFPVAFNDAPGPWKVKASEIFSLKTAEGEWEVK
jgi:hypothetical protein